jgi:hypothetical protein
VADDLRREAMAGVAGAEGHGHPARLPVPVCDRKLAPGNLTVPYAAMFGEDLVAGAMERRAFRWPAGTRRTP